MSEFLKNITGRVPCVRLAKQKASQNISTYFKGAKIDSKRKEAKIMYNASKSKLIKPEKITDKDNNKLKKRCLRQINEDIENNNNNVQKCDSNDSDAENDNQQLCFSMLCTDDEDDYDYENDDSDSSSDEANAKSNNRPPPPEWSLTINRKSNVINQTEIDPCVIDKFFGCEAELIDMLEIFPKMNPRKAKRRKSSIKWDTPLLVHSVLPKY